MGYQAFTLLPCYSTSHAVMLQLLVNENLSYIVFDIPWCLLYSVGAALVLGDFLKLIRQILVRVLLPSSQQRLAASGFLKPLQQTNHLYVKQNTCCVFAQL